MAEIRTTVGGNAMRLTLRTLLAWLDDMLPTQEVREIGHQVSDSPYAREIVERIRRVTRQRRLSVPPDDENDGNDPNRVAEYLDNVLSAEQVAEFERVCLTSDVHLAEVASAHQILSLLGQKAKVPPDARYRMYHLVKGRETLGERAKRDQKGVRDEPVAAALPLATPADAPKLTGSARTVAIAAALALGSLLAWSTWDNLRPVPQRAERGPGALAIATAAPAGEGVPKSASVVQAPGATPPGGAAPPTVAGPVDPAELAIGPALGAASAIDAALPGEGDEVAEVMVDVAGAAEKSAASAAGRTERAVPAGEVGTVKETDGVLLRKTGASEPWERPAVGARLHAGEVLASLDPFRSTIDLEGVLVKLVGRANVELREPSNGDDKLDLRDGQVVVRSPVAAGIGLGLATGTARVDLPANVPVGLEHVGGWQAGVSGNVGGLRVHVPEGEVKVTVGEASETVRGPGVVEIEGTGRLTAKSGGATPEWVVERTPPALDTETGRQFLRFFRDGQPPLPNLVEAASSDRPEIRRLALEALGQIGQYSVVVTALSAPEQPETRRVAIDVLRAGLAQGGSHSERLRQELERAGDEAWLSVVTQLLGGVVKTADADPGPALLKLLENDDVGVRELALDNLMRVTNRGDNLGYNPDAPTPEALRAWGGLIEKPQPRGANGRP